MRVSATVPVEGKAAQAVQIADVSTGLTLPESAVGDLAGSGAASVEARTQLTVEVAQGSHSAEAVWAGSTGDPVTVPESGALELAAPGAVPSVTAGESGDLTFTAAELTVLLTANKADGTPPGRRPRKWSALRRPVRIRSWARCGSRGPGNRTRPGRRRRLRPAPTVVPMPPSRATKRRPGWAAQRPRHPARCLPVWATRTTI
ncbi:DUF6801 domain-containing protein [Streptomyces sp. M10(2022)]